MTSGILVMRINSVFWNLSAGTTAKQCVMHGCTLFFGKLQKNLRKLIHNVQQDGRWLGELSKSIVYPFVGYQLVAASDWQRTTSGQYVSYTCSIFFSSQDTYRPVVFPRNTLLSFSWEPKDLWRFAWWSSPLLWPPRHICMMLPITGVSFLELYVGYMLCTRPWPPCNIASNFPGDIV